MDQWLVHMNFPRNLYGPMALKVLWKFQSWPVLVHRVLFPASWGTCDLVIARMFRCGYTLVILFPFWAKSGDMLPKHWWWPGNGCIAPILSQEWWHVVQKDFLVFWFRGLDVSPHLSAPKSQRFLRFAIAMPIADHRNRSDFREKRKQCGTAI